MVSKRRVYTNEEKGLALVALDANAGNVARTARQIKIPRVTLLDWSQNRSVSGEVSDIRHLKKKEFSDKLEELAHQLIDVLPAKLAAANLKQLSISLGIIIDKMLLLRNQLTSINKDTAPLTDEERAARVLEILERGRARMLIVETPDQ